jgi:hypothetical protein
MPSRFAPAILELLSCVGNTNLLVKDLPGLAAEDQLRLAVKIHAFGAIVAIAKLW